MPRIGTQLIGVALWCLSGQGQSSKAPPAGDDEKRLLALERQWAAAEVKHDAAVLDRILDDRFLFIDPPGQTRDKAAFVSAALKFAIASQTLSDETVRVYGDTSSWARILFNLPAESCPIRCAT